MNIVVGKDTGSYVFSASAGTITFSGIGTVTLSDIFLITNVTDNVILYNFAAVGRGGTISSNVLTLQYDTSTMSDTDVIQIVFDVGFPYIDFGLGLLKMQEQSPLWKRYTAPVPLVSAQDLTASWADFGAEIDCQGYTHLGIYLKADTNNSTIVTLKALAKIESGGTDEYDIADTGELPLWSVTTADFSKYYEMELGPIPFVQLQAMAGVVGATPGDLTIHVNKIWRP